MNQTKRAQVRRIPERGKYDPETIHAVLDAGFLAHVGFVVEGQPFVIPTLYGRKEDKLFLHGSAASRMLRELETGVSACVTVTLVDGLVLARSAFNHSMNYRSVVAFGVAHKVIDSEQKVVALRAISDHVIPGRWNEVRGPNERELKATTVLEFSIEEASAKVRTGPPSDEDEDYALPIWAGVLPFTLATQPEVADSRLASGLRTPASVARFREKRERAKTGS